MFGREAEWEDLGPGVQDRKETFINMNYETFLKERDRVAELSVQEQKDFYAKILEEEQKESSIRLQAYFHYAVLFYYEGDFRRTIEILEPFTISYQSYEYIPEMIACFNLMGVASHCEGEYILARYCYTLALKVVTEKKADDLLAREYNNLSLTYIAVQDYETAFSYIQMAEKYLPLADEDMGAYVYLNKSDIYNHLGQQELAVEAFEASIQEYNGQNVLPDDTLICGVSLYYKMGDQEKYQEYIHKILDKLGDMYASEFIDACKVIFDCSLAAGDYKLVEIVIAKMDSYMQTHPQENRVGLKVEELKYNYAQKLGDIEGKLTALERKNHYYELIVTSLEEQRANAIDEYLETHRHLQEAVQNETQANRAKTRFLANMSHDIRTPMNAIMGIVNLMEHSLNDPEKMEDYLSKLQLSSRHMLGLINDLLDMNKIESGVSYLNTEPMKLAEQVTQVLDIIRTQALEKRQNFQVHTHHVRHENLIADGIRLRQIMLNVLSNAVKYTPEDGEIQFDIEELPCENKGRAKYLFVVKDTGIGMTSDLLEHIFDPFIRGEDSVVNKIQGTGLGMAITKGIIDMMGGTIQVESKVQKGSRVSITLEFDIDQEEDARMETLKLLVLSDDKMLSEELSASAAEKAVFLTCVSDVKDVQKELEKNATDVVLLCSSFCREDLIRELRRIAGETTIFLVLDNPSGKMHERLPKGINGKITWPFFFTNLEKEINHVRSYSMGVASGESILNGMNFLCAEDNALNAEILAASLEIAGASCTIYADGTTLVDAFENVKPGEYEAILMDIQMPNMNGYEATQLIRKSQNELGKSIPIIAMTANAFVDDVKNSFAVGMNAHISKPIDMAILERTMRRLKSTQEETA